MITWIAANGDYGRPAMPGWRGRDWSTCERDALIGRRRVHYLDAGTGERAFMLVHGMGGRWQHWLETIPALAKHGRVLALDLPGFGQSEAPAAPVSLNGFADVAAALIHDLKVERAVLIGHSMGGPIALRFASRHPELAEAIVAVGGAVFQFSALLGLHEVLRFTTQRPRETAAIAAEIATAGLRAPGTAQRLIASTPRLRRLFLAPYLFDPGALPSDSAGLIVGGAGAPGVLPTARAIGRSNPLAGAEDVNCSILSIAGEHDRITPLSDTEAFQREVPRARTVVLEACGHMAMLERPQAFNAQLLAFAESLPACSPTQQTQEHGHDQATPA